MSVLHMTLTSLSFLYLSRFIVLLFLFFFIFSFFVFFFFFFFFSSRRRHTRCSRDWSSDVCSSDLRHELHVRRRRKDREGDRQERRRRSVHRVEGPPEDRGGDGLQSGARQIGRASCRERV